MHFQKSKIVSDFIKQVGFSVNQPSTLRPQKTHKIFESTLLNSVIGGFIGHNFSISNQQKNNKMLIKRPNIKTDDFHSNTSYKLNNNQCIKVAVMTAFLGVPLTVLIVNPGVHLSIVSHSVISGFLMGAANATLCYKTCDVFYSKKTSNSLTIRL